MKKKNAFIYVELELWLVDAHTRTHTHTQRKMNMLYAYEMGTTNQTEFIDSNGVCTDDVYK